MALASKLLGLWLAERTVASTTPLFMRLLGAVAAIAVLAAMACALFALLLAGLLWVIYEQLLAYGLSQPMALVSMMGLVLIMVGILTLYIQHYIHQIKTLSSHVLVSHGPVTGGISSVANAFVRGLRSSAPLYRD